MKRVSMLMLMTAVLCGTVMAGQAIAADPQDNPPPKRDGGAGGPGGGGPGGPPPAGYHLLPRFTMEKLNLTDDQIKQMADLEKDVKEKLSKILTPDQMKTVETARPPRRGPGGPPDDKEYPGAGRGAAGPGNPDNQSQCPQRPAN